jgi:hypothetical protein
MLGTYTHRNIKFKPRSPVLTSWLARWLGNPKSY